MEDKNSGGIFPAYTTTDVSRLSPFRGKGFGDEHPPLDKSIGARSPRISPRGRRNADGDVPSGNRRNAGRPVGAETGGNEIRMMAVEHYATRLGISPHLLMDHKKIFNIPGGWPIRNSEKVINGEFMESLALKLPFTRDNQGRLINSEKIAFAGGGIFFDGCIYASSTHSPKRKSITIRPQISIGQSDLGVLNTLQQYIGLNAGINQGATNERTNVVRTPYNLVWDGVFAVAVAAITYPFLLTKQRQALVMTRLYFEGLFFSHPRSAGWPPHLWEHRLDLAENLSGLKGRLNRRPRQVRPGGNY